VPGQPDALGCRYRPGGGDGVADQVGEGDLLQRQPQGAGVDLRQLEQVIDHAGEPVGFDPDPVVIALDGPLVAGDPVLQRLGHSPDARKRRAQVVADPGHQLPAAGLQRPLPPAGLLQLTAHLAQLPVQGGQLGRQRLRRVDVALSQVRCGDAQRPAAGDDRTPQQHGGDEPHRARHDGHDDQDRKVVRGQEHRVAGQQRPDQHRRDRNQGDGDRRVRQRPAPQLPKSQHPAGGDGQRAAGSEGDDDRQVGGWDHWPTSSGS